MADLIRFVLTNLPLILFAAALVIPTIWREGPTATRYLRWILLLSAGVAMIWGGFFHVFFPAIAAAPIGWQVSPFQFEVGVADMAAGIVAVISFWKGYAYRLAVSLYIILFDLGVAVGHVRETIVANDYAPDNFGPLLVITILQAILLSLLLWKSRQESTGE